MSRRRLAFLASATAAIAAYLAWWPVEITPGEWTPEPAPALEGPLAQNSVLSACERIGKNVGHAPEDVAIDLADRLYVGFEDGRIVRFQPDGSAPEEFANTAGRPLGLEFDRQNNLIVCDSYKGLLRVDMSGHIFVLATEHAGRRFGFTDDLDIADDGTIYFTDASWKFGQKQYVDDLLEHQPNGRLLAYDPVSGATRLLVDNLHFANGVAVAPRDEFVLVTETGKYRVLRYWLRGPRQGQTEIFMKNLPGFPDGITTGDEGRFWIALAAPRDALLDALLPRPGLRKALMRLPRLLLPAPARYSFVLAVDANGAVLRNYQDLAGAYAPITNVREHAGKLYFGSIEEDGFGRFTPPSQ